MQLLNMMALSHFHLRDAAAWDLRLRLIWAAGRIEDHVYVQIEDHVT